jgi:tetratricopeptide (TPR) repeat protein
MRKIVVVAAILMLAIAALGQETPQPVDARGWFQLGIKRHDAGDFQGALQAYIKAQQMGLAAQPALSIRMARAYAQTGEKEKAIALLEQIANNGFGAIAVLNAQDDLIPIRTDPRWKKIVERVDHNAHPCTAVPEYRQFDYWLGEWDVEIGGQKLAQSSIQLILDDCVIFENYADSRSYSGKSFSIYDATTKKWEQRYVDTTGAFHTWTGGLENGRMVFYWKTQQNGKDVLQRMTYEKEGPDRVRQLIDRSSDDGKTWSPGYNGLYTRRK